ncbi:MAG TPA: spore cortex biosynthesis protein YabQ [Clostridium sp.]|jgi:spore cortex biosynthesis protein YabQ|uniref:spore cortex biosynthesis protein YabQ n=1 Tax=unclassified Clostridium TaxID=2614128 RepID=UPI000EDBDCC3|nr:spore cortex biosynthesis protein YabQ [Clostridium sp.]
MIFDMGRQITLFIFSLLSGMLVGIFFDVYRVIRGFEQPGIIITAIQDLLFWILTGIIVFIFMMYTNYAYMSFNVFVYNGIGLFIYFKLFSHIFLLGYGKVLNAILAIFRVTFYYLFYPIRIIFYKIIKKT